MARNAWHINEDDLDSHQDNVLNLKVNSSFIVKGCAGSGKTNLSLWRAKRIQETEEGEYRVLIYTKALRKFIESGLREIGLDMAKVIHYDQWDKQPVDYIIVDEAQDFSETEILSLKNKALKSIALFGDSAQQLYDKKSINGTKEDTLTIEQIADVADLGKPKELVNNYRLPMPVARLAQFLNDSGNDIISNCKNLTGSSKPRIIRFNSIEQELDFIINEINSKSLKDVGILLPFNEKNKTGLCPKHWSIEAVRSYFDSRKLKHLFKQNDHVELDFDSDLPKLLTYHSSKGLQFDAVFIPHCSISWGQYKNPLYVAITRSSQNLIITHSEALSPFLSIVPKNLYDTI